MRPPRQCVTALIAAAALIASVGSIPTAGAAEPTSPADSTTPVDASTQSDEITISRPVFVDPDLSDAALVRVRGEIYTIAGEGGVPNATYFKMGERDIPIDSGWDQVLPPGTTVDATLAVDERSASRLGAEEGAVITGRDRTAILTAAERTGEPLGLASAQTSTPLGAPIPTTTYRWIVAIPTNWGAPTTGATDAQILAHVNSTRDYWLDESDNAVAINVDPTFRRYTSKYPTSYGCGLKLDSTHDDVVAEAVSVTGANLAAGDRVIVVVPYAPCKNPDAIGVATLGTGFNGAGPGIVTVDDPAKMLFTAIHEFGHSFSFEHSGSGCSGTSNYCFDPYGGRYEPMGSAPNTAPALGSAYRALNGITTTDEIAEFTIGDGSAVVNTSFRLMPRANEAGLRGVHLIDPDTGYDLYFDYRSGTDRDATAFYTRRLTSNTYAYAPGVVVSRRLKIKDGSRFIQGTQLVDPATVPDVLNKPTSIAAGPLWQSKSKTLEAQVSQADGSGATTWITYRPGPAFDGGTASISGIVRGLESVRAMDRGVTPYADNMRYQWFADGLPIAGATNADFTIPIELVGKQLAVNITAYTAGRRPYLMASPTATVAPATLRASSSAIPTVTGVKTVGGTLSTTSNAGIAINRLSQPVAATSSFQWFRGTRSTPIAGATGATYVTSAADVKNYVGVVETITAPGYDSLTGWSAGFGPIEAPAPPPPPPAPTKAPALSIWAGVYPKVTGYLNPGRSLKVTKGSWIPGTKVTIRWQVNGKTVSTKWSLRLKRSWAGKKLKIIVTGTKAGYTSRSFTKSYKIKRR